MNRHVLLLCLASVVSGIPWLPAAASADMPARWGSPAGRGEYVTTSGETGEDGDRRPLSLSSCP